MSEYNNSAYENLLNKIGEETITIKRLIHSESESEMFFKVLLDGEIKYIKKAGNDAVFINIDDINGRGSQIEDDKKKVTFLDKFQTEEELAESLTENLDDYEEEIPLGYFKKIKIEDEKEEKVYYLINKPQIEETVNFYRNESNISVDQESEEYSPYRKTNDLKQEYLLLEISNNSKEDKTCDGKITKITSFDEISKIKKVFMNEEISPITDTLLRYIYWGEKETDETKKIKTDIDEQFKKLEDATMEDILETNNIYSNKKETADWALEFYESLRNTYGKTKDLYSNSEKEQLEKQNSIFYSVLRNQIGLTEEKAEEALIDIENYYKELLLNIETNGNNINFIDLYYEYEKRMKEDPNLKKQELDNLYFEMTEASTDLERNKIIENNKLKRIENRRLFEENLILGNIKFPLEYQTTIRKKFEDIKLNYEREIILDIVKNPNIINLFTSEEMQNLKDFYSNLKNYPSLSEETKDALVLKKYSELKEKGIELLKTDENFINKYISNQIIPREYKVYKVINMQKPTKEPVIIYSNKTDSLEKEYVEKTLENGEICGYYKYNLITHLGSKGDFKKTIGSTDEVDSGVKFVSKIKKYFKTDKNFDKFIDNEYEKYFMLEHYNSLGIESTGRKSYISDISKYSEEILEKGNAIIYREYNADSKNSNIKLIYLPNETKIEDVQTERKLEELEISISQKGEDDNTSKKDFTEKIRKDAYSIESLKSKINKHKKYNENKDTNHSTAMIVINKKEIDEIKNLIKELDELKKDKNEIEEKLSILKEANDSEEKITKLEKKLEEKEVLIKEKIEKQEQIYSKIENKLDNELEFITNSKTLQKTKIISKVEKTPVKPFISYKNTKVELLDALNKNHLVVLNDFRGTSKDSIRILCKGIDDNIQELKITKKGIKSFENFLTNIEGNPDPQAYKYFDITTSFLTGESLQKLLEDNTSKNTSSYILDERYKNIVESFWDIKNNELKADFDTNKYERENLNAIIQKSYGRNERIHFDKDVEFKFFEDKNGFKTMLKVEKNDDNTYNIHLVKNYESSQTSIKISNIEYKEGKFIIKEDSSKIIYPKNQFIEKRDDEIDTIKGVLTNLNLSMRVNKVSMDSIDTYINTNPLEESPTEYNQLFESVFKLHEMNSLLRNDLLDRAKQGIKEATLVEDLYESTTKNFYPNEENNNNLLLTLLSEDLKISRTDEDVDCDELSKKMVEELRNVIISENPETFKDALNTVVKNYILNQEANSKEEEQLLKEVITLSSNEKLEELQKLNPSITDKKIEQIKDTISNTTELIYKNLEAKIKQEVDVITGMETSILNHYASNPIWKKENDKKAPEMKFLNTIGSCVEKNLSDRIIEGKKDFENSNNEPTPSQKTNQDFKEGTIKLSQLPVFMRLTLYQELKDIDENNFDSKNGRLIKTLKEDSKNYIEKIRERMGEEVDLDKLLKSFEINKYSECMDTFIKYDTLIRDEIDSDENNIFKAYFKDSPNLYNFDENSNKEQLLRKGEKFLFKYDEFVIDIKVENKAEDKKARKVKADENCNSADINLEIEVKNSELDKILSPKIVKIQTLEKETEEVLENE